MKMFAFLLLFALSLPVFSEPAKIDCDLDVNATRAECTAGSCTMSLEDVEGQMQQEIENCRRVENEASDCCSNPMNCSNDSMGSTGGSDMSQLMKMMMSVSAATLMAQSSPDQMASMSQICSMFGGMNTAGANVNNNTAQACNGLKQKCSNACLGADQFWLGVEKCNKEEGVKDFINKTRGQFATSNKSCNAMNAAAIKAQATNQASAGNGSMQNVCNQLAQQQQQPQMQQLNAITAPNVPDCTNPMLATTNVCVVCNSAGADSTACQQAITDSAGANASFQPSSSLGNNANSFNAGDPGTVAQNAQFGDGSQNNNAANNPMSPYGGGGGSGMLPSSQQAGGGPDGQNRRGMGPGYNTAVLQGERGVSGIGGLGGSMGVDTSSGFSGYGNAAAPPGLDLKNYLPGRQLYAGRKVAGVGSANPDINPRTTDLFKRISDRFKVICSLNRLVDCAPAPIPNKTGL